MTATPQVTTARRERWITALVLGGIALLFLFRLGALGFFDPDEGRYAAIPDAMLRTGDYVVPYLQGFPYLEKPPLLYWMTAATLRVFGHNEFAGRLPVAIAGYAGVLALWWIVRRTRGPLEAWLAAGVLALSMEWFVEARFLTTDMLLAGLFSVGLACFWRGVSTGVRWWYWGLYVSIALATLTKGLIGFVLPGAIVFLFLLVTRRLRLLLKMDLLPGVILFGLLVVPWFWLVQERFPRFLHWFLYDQHVARYIGRANGLKAEHARPPWFFAGVILLGFFPWVVHLFFVRKRDWADGARADARDFQWFLALWFGVIFLFFSASSGKLVSYILPAFPPLAAFVAQLFAKLWAPAEDVARDAARRVRAAALAGGVVWLAFAPLALIGLPKLIVRDGRINPEDVSRWPVIFGTVWGVSGLVVVALALARRVRAAIAAQAVFCVVMFMTMLSAMLAVEPLMNPKPLAEALEKNVKPGDLVVLCGIPQPSLEFYLRRPPMLVAFQGEYKFGMSLEPNPLYFQEDRAVLPRLLASDRQVYVVADKDDREQMELARRYTVIAQNTKRIVYRNEPGAGIGIARR